VKAGGEYLHGIPQPFPSNAHLVQVSVIIEIARGGVFAKLHRAQQPADPIHAASAA